MNELLKDYPEHKERIENNFLLGENIKDQLNSATIDVDIDDAFENDICRKIITALEDVEFEIVDGKVIIDDKELLAQAIYGGIKDELEDALFSIRNPGIIAEAIRDEITDFVNDNYEWRGVR